MAAEGDMCLGDLRIHDHAALAYDLRFHISNPLRQGSEDRGTQIIAQVGRFVARFSCLTDETSRIYVANERSSQESTPANDPRCNCCSVAESGKQDGIWFDGVR